MEYKESEIRMIKKMRTSRREEPRECKERKYKEREALEG